jgi:hypothetical protein
MAPHYCNKCSSEITGDAFIQSYGWIIMGTNVAGAAADRSIGGRGHEAAPDLIRGSFRLGVAAGGSGLARDYQHSALEDAE